MSKKLTARVEGFFLLRPKEESLNTLILNTSAALPVFTLVAVTLMEI